MIRVLIVDDSRTARLVLTRVLEKERDFDVVGAAADAFEARNLILSRNPDVITLDLQMPRMNGLEFLEKLMAHHPLPVVIVSSLTQDRSREALRALRLGAVEVVGKARLGSDAAAAAPLVHAIRAAGQARIRRSSATRGHRPMLVQPPTHRDHATSVIAIGASTGGTRAIEDLLRQLPADFPGIVIAQHLPAAFTASFAARLNAVSALSVREARHGEFIESGTALIAPGGSDTAVAGTRQRPRVHILRRDNADGDASARMVASPSIDVLFRSVAAAFGPASVGILLTGMGSDGAIGLAEMRSAGAFTIAEHEETCVVYGMPRAAAESDAATAILPLYAIPDALVQILAAAGSV